MLEPSEVVRFSGPLWESSPDSGIALKRARIRDKISGLTETTIEFTSSNPDLNLSEMIGEVYTLTIALGDGSFRKHHGTCTEAQFLYVEKGTAHYLATLHPFTWVLANTKNSQIFQQKNVMDIVKDILNKHGFSDYKDNTVRSLPKREYCVQYRESDLAFISRLLEEEGIYYFLDHEDSAEKIVFADGKGAHSSVAGGDLIKFRGPDDATPLEEDHFSVIRGRETVKPTKVSLLDYNFEVPRVAKGKKNSSQAVPKGKFFASDGYELFDYPGGFREDDDGQKYADFRIEAATHGTSVLNATGNVRNVHVGGLFKLINHPRSDWNKEYLVIAASTTIEENSAYDEETKSSISSLQSGAKSSRYSVQSKVEIIDSDTQFRPPQITPVPDISGVHVAKVVGKSGEEIWTDKYGRVKLHFFWDREGKKDETATCWVRVATPFAGKKWGMVHVPRIGQEVIVQFEEGNPDRPIVTGMLYNGENMPPYALPGNATMQGIKTNKSKGGGGFNELVFEDKAGAEYVRLQSERDYKEIIKNNAEISIGEEHKDKGDLTETIHRHKTQTLKTGDHTFKIEQGSQKVEIKKDRTETIEGKRTQTVTKDVTETYKAKLTQTITGNVTTKVKSGNVATTIDKGNVTETISLGNLKIKTSAGKVQIEALQSIELKVGPTKIKLDMMGVSINGMMLKFKGSAMANVEAPIVSVKGQTMATLEAPMTTVDGKAMTMVKGAITMVN